MKTIKKRLVNLVLIVFSLYLALCIGLYFYQEKIIFYPQKLPADYHFKFNQPFEEIPITATDGIKLNGLLFLSTVSNQPSKGLIFYLHGNAGSLQGWGDVVNVYTNLGYDVFLL